ncbi:hypothetical protein QFC20_007431 [Naganishia adeliensis]|uniref:Uncharacterized protein n=1 Tax=Naganishia adeliensis TaxID=92952 RepID=A0ACC2UZ49_9TREE|nr:hypothetical protein QFC20_007431 [Naganishia adeliensis]
MTIVKQEPLDDPVATSRSACPQDPQAADFLQSPVNSSLVDTPLLSVSQAVLPPDYVDVPLVTSNSCLAWSDVFNDDLVDDNLPVYSFGSMPSLTEDASWETDAPPPSYQATETAPPVNDSVTMWDDVFRLNSDVQDYRPFSYPSSIPMAWEDIVDGFDNHQADHAFAPVPPEYSAIDPAVAPDDYALSPATMSVLNDFLTMYPNVTFRNGQWVLPEPVTDCIDPSLLQHKSKYNGDDVPGAGALPLPPIKLNNDDINDQDAAVLAAPSSEEELSKMLADSSDDEEEVLEVDMIGRHLWVGYQIKYIVHTSERSYRLTAEQMQERFAGTREAQWKYWESKRGGKVPARKIRRHLRQMGISGFFREMLWHLLSEEEYKKLLKLRKQGALHLWKW